MGRDAKAELPSGEKTVAAVSADGQERAAAWECRAALESRQAGEISTPRFKLNQKKIFRFGGGEIRSDLSSRALGRRRWHGVGS